MNKPEQIITSYAQAVKNTKIQTNHTNNTHQTENNLPKMDQAIILATINEVPADEYVCAVGEIVNPSNIIYAFKMEFDRMCIYLKDKNMANKFVEQNLIINIKGFDILVRHLIKPAKRLIINGVNPFISDNLIIEKLEQLELKIDSPMKSLRYNVKNPEYVDGLSDRRQICIQPTDDEIPDSAFITNGTTKYRIYICDKSVRCNTCNRSENKTEKCKLNNKPTQETQESLNSQYNTIEEVQPTQSQQTNKHIKNAEIQQSEINNEINENLENTKDDVTDIDEENMILSNTSFKRSALSGSAKSIDDQNIQPIENTQNKSRKRNRSTNLKNINTESWIDD